MNFEHAKKIEHDLHEYLPSFLNFNSTPSLEESPLYQNLKPKILKVLNSYELEQIVPPPSPESYYRAVSWNVERGMEFDAIIYFLKNHPILSKADFILMTETDLGMARSGNRNVARDIAKLLGMNYFFAPSYLNLAKGSGIEQEVSGDNQIGIHGNAILSRYPIHKPRLVSLPNPHDKMKGREKRLGNQRALIATLDLGGQALRAACLHVNVRSKQSDRKREVESVIKALVEEGSGPAILGGDWNTSTYDSHSAASAIIGFWVRVFMGVGRVMRHHYPHPYHYFEKDLFDMLERNGFDYKKCNELGACTTHFSVESIKQFKNLREWIPNWCFRFIEWSLKDHGGQCSFKLDWFTQRNLKILLANEDSTPRKGPSLAPKVIGQLIHQGREASDHDALVFDFKFS